MDASEEIKMAKILVTGSTGFIGKRLVYQLLEQGHEVYALSRIRGIEPKIAGRSRLHVIFGDLRDLAGMEPIPEDIEAAYYLVHSMASVVDNLLEEERKTAQNFVSLIEKTGCKQSIYLGGIIEDDIHLSPHLRSRLAVEEVLKNSKVNATILRASIIIGSGSASFEIIRDLVEKLPVMTTPRWIHSRCHPIGVRDVLFYLTGVLLNPLCYGKTFDIGGPEEMSFKEALQRYAKLRKLKRLILDIPLLTPRLSSYWLVLVTSVPFSICKHLVESMRQNTRKLNTSIDAVLPHVCISYEEAIRLAFQKIAQNEVVSTWADAWDLKTVNADTENFIRVPQEGCFKEVRTVKIKVPIEEVQRRIWSIGGAQGWYSMNWTWKVRGLIDQLIGGKGLNRGRRDPHKLVVGDAVDFWRVILADEKKRHLILYAEMKLPGEAWLEFQIDETAKTLKQTATFRPKGVWGRIYWYVSFVFHLIIFKNMAKAIAT